MNEGKKRLLYFRAVIFALAFNIKKVRFFGSLTASGEGVVWIHPKKFHRNLRVYDHEIITKYKGSQRDMKSGTKFDKSFLHPP